MENFDENLENEYRKRFGNFDEMPDDMLWEKIQARIKPEKERPFIVWWSNMRGPVGIAATVLLGLLLGVYFFIQPDHTVRTGDLPKQPNEITSQPRKPDLTQKDNTVASNTATGIKTGNPVNNEPKPLASTETIGNQKNRVAAQTPGLKKTQLATTDTQETIAKVSVEKKNQEENKPIIAVNPVTQESGTEKSVITETKPYETEKAVLAHNDDRQAKETAKTIAEEKTGEPKLAVNPVPDQPVGSADALANEANPVLVVKDTLFPNINTLNGKEVQQLAVTARPLEAPELPVAELSVAEEEKRRLVFIPPTEIFANVSSTLSYYMFSPNKGDQILVNNFSSSSQRLGFAAQLGFVYPLAKKMDLRTGMSYFQGKSRISYGITDNSQKSVTVLNDNSVQINPGRSTKDENRNWQYFELQSDVLYEVKKMHALSLGMKFGLQTSAINKPLLQARLGYRVSKAIAEHWALWLEPTVSVSLSSHHALENLFMYRTTGFGLNMGVSLLR
ncbi:hypothetical protein [Emticicia sp. BO119]|uniref:hypothetical protein n=1 Tax=Emticicia sp. BO119 TaxID=2757768 RepID=UPI0015F0B59E|nr:hypothetical protein [Emticicia sp. BO119]MBA4851474.1 hypothetical protein [Emticicia sp. BO119]